MLFGSTPVPQSSHRFQVTLQCIDSRLNKGQHYQTRTTLGSLSTLIDGTTIKEHKVVLQILSTADCAVQIYGLMAFVACIDLPLELQSFTTSSIYHGVCMSSESQIYTDSCGYCSRPRRSFRSDDIEHNGIAFTSNRMFEMRLKFSWLSREEQPHVSGR